MNAVAGSIAKEDQFISHHYLASYRTVISDKIIEHNVINMNDMLNNYECLVKNFARGRSMKDRQTLLTENILCRVYT